MKTKRLIIYFLAIAMSLGSFFVTSNEFGWLRNLLIVGSFLLIIFLGIHYRSKQGEYGDTRPAKGVYSFILIACIIAILLVVAVWIDVI